MNAVGKEQPVLNPIEWELVMELLERERREIPAEIHHTTSRAFREKLQGRLETLDGVLDRLRKTAPK